MLSLVLLHMANLLLVCLHVMLPLVLPILLVCLQLVLVVAKLLLVRLHLHLGLALFVARLHVWACGLVDAVGHELVGLLQPMHTIPGP